MTKLTSSASIRPYLFVLIFAGIAGAQALTDEEVWPTGVNGPRKWPPELANNFSTPANGYKYPEGGEPPPLDLHQRIKCPEGTSRQKITRFGSARWETSRHHPPIYAFDEWSVSRWSSWDKNAKHIWADLGSEKTVKRVVLVWETAYGKDYDIQVGKDTSTWTTAKAYRGGNGQADVVDMEGTGRYVQMMGVMGGSTYGYSLYEFSICATGAPTGLRRTGEAASPAKGRKWVLAVTPGGLPLGVRAYDASGRPDAGKVGAAAGARFHPVTGE